MVLLGVADLAVLRLLARLEVGDARVLELVVGRLGPAQRLAHERDYGEQDNGDEQKREHVHGVGS